MNDKLTKRVKLPATPFFGEREIELTNYPTGAYPDTWWTSAIPVRGWKVFFPASGLVYPRKRYSGKAVAEACERWNNSPERSRYIFALPPELLTAADNDYFTGETWNDYTDDFRLTPAGEWIKDRTYRSDYLL